MRIMRGPVNGNGMPIDKLDLTGTRHAQPILGEEDAINDDALFCSIVNYCTQAPAN